MATIQYNRRNFLNSLAILSIGTSFGSTIKHLPAIKEKEDLQKKWTVFCKSFGGRKFYPSADLSQHNNFEIKGHLYKYGEIIFFPIENIVAQPTWIFWKNNFTKPADVVVTLFKNNESFTKILRFNRYEMDALYRISKEPGSEELLLASCNDRNPMAGATNGIITAKTNIKTKSHIQDISYYKGDHLIYKDKIIHHT